MAAPTVSPNVEFVLEILSGELGRMSGAQLEEVLLLVEEEEFRRIATALATDQPRAQRSNRPQED